MNEMASRFFSGFKQGQRELNTQLYDNFKNFKWDVHINNTTSLIYRATNSIPQLRHGKGIVLGAGSCSDIPLEYLAQNLSKVYLVDIDRNALERGVIQHNKDIQKKTKLVIDDISLFGKTLMPSFFEKVRQGHAQAAIGLLEDIKWQSQAIIPSIGQKKFKLVISSCILSQLTVLWYRVLLAMAPNLHSVHSAFVRFCNNVVLDNHLAMLKNYCSQDGKVVITADIFMWGTEEGNPSPLNDIIDDPTKIDFSTLSDPNMATYRLLGTYPVEKTIHNHLHIEYATHWLWQFNRNKSYFILGYVCSPNK